MPSVRDRLLGSWSLLDWKIRAGEDLIDFLPPLGLAKDCGGALIYASNGWMSATMSRKDRPQFAGMAVDGGTPEERADAFISFASYCGPFDVAEEAGEVTHNVAFSSNPNFVGQKLKRLCIFDGDRLRLDTPPMMMGGQLRSSYIDWVRN
jgi:hypothetical protein